MNVGSAYPLREEKRIEVAGRDLSAGLPRRAIVTSEEIREALSGPVKRIIEAIRHCLEQTPPELSSDLVHTGVTLCGGGALLRGLAAAIEEEIQLPVRVAEEPLTAVARGTGEFLDQLELYSKVLETGDEV
jgi:rod shape-determining protein MreB